MTLTLAAGQWYVHIRSVDRAGNGSSTLHLGPYLLDGSAPQSRTASPGTSAVATVPVSWSGTDAGAGIASYTIQVRDGVTGAWQNWLVDVPATTVSASYAAALCGHTYFFRSLARDLAGNLEVKTIDQCESTTSRATNHALVRARSCNIAGRARFQHHDQFPRSLFRRDHRSSREIQPVL